MGLVVNHLRSLARFSGREGQRDFWLWFAIVFGAAVVLSMLVMAPLMLRLMAEIRAYALTHPESTQVTTGTGGYEVTVHDPDPALSARFLATMMPMIATGLVLGLAQVLLLAAAVARRLHDTGRRGFWGLLPLPFAATGLALFPGLLRSQAGTGLDMRLLGGLVVNNMVYMALLVTLLIMLALPGSRAENRFGPPPA